MELTSSSMFPKINPMRFLCVILNSLLTWKEQRIFFPLSYLLPRIASQGQGILYQQEQNGGQYPMPHKLYK